LWAPEIGEEIARTPDAGEAPFVANVPRKELVVDHEGAGINIADWIDQADDATRPTHVEPWEGLTEGI
jgi:hypothetical protein